MGVVDRTSEGLDLGFTCDQSGCCFENRLEGTKLVTVRGSRARRNSGLMDGQ